LKNFRKNNQRAVSEVLGALLLMLVVVIAVGTFAFYLSSLQSQGEARENFLNSVKNDKLQITNLQMYPSNPSTLYEFQFNKSYIISGPHTGDISSSVEYVNMMSFGVEAYNYSSSNDLLFGPGSYYNMIQGGVAAYVCAPTGTYGTGFPICTPSTSYSIFLQDAPTADACNVGSQIAAPVDCSVVFSLAQWYSANVTVRNLNTQNSGIDNVQVNSQWINSFNTTLPISQVTPQNGGLYSSNASGFDMSSPLFMPSEDSQTLYLNFSTLDNQSNSNLLKTGSLSFTILSTAGNYFSTFYAAPTTLVQDSVISFNDNTYTVDVPTFTDVQGSDLNGTIQSYIWRVDVPNSTSWSYWNQYSQMATAFSYTSSFQFEPEDLFASELASPSFATINQNLDIEGPFNITLVAVNQYGLLSDPSSIIFSPSDNKIAPVNDLSVSSSSPTCASGPTITATLLEQPYGTPAPENSLVTFQAMGSFTLSSPAAYTNSAGQASVTVNSASCPEPGNYAVQVTYGNLVPFTIVLS
jgi:flagellin-like protein